MCNKNVNRIIMAIFIFAFLTFLTLLIFNIIFNSAFFEGTLVEISNFLFFAIGAFWIASVTRRSKEKKNHIEETTGFIQTFIREDKMKDMNANVSKRTILNNQRLINNKIEILELYKKEMNLKSEIDTLIEKFTSYKEFIGDNIENRVYLVDSIAEIEKMINQVDYACDKVRFSIHN